MLPATVVLFHSVAQRRIALDQVHDEEYEMSKPLARFADDEDLERMLKACPRDGDPMLQFIKKKEKTSTVSIKKGIDAIGVFW